jgi:hypothetical protein
VEKQAKLELKPAASQQEQIKATASLSGDETDFTDGAFCTMQDGCVSCGS